MEFHLIRLRGSATIEAAVIVPIFMIMLVQLVLASLDCHDAAVLSCIGTKSAVIAEFGGRKNEDYKKKINELSAKVNAYVEDKTVSRKSNIQIKNNMLSISAGKSVIAKNDPVEFTWLTDAAKKIMKMEA